MPGRKTDSGSEPLSRAECCGSSGEVDPMYGLVRFSEERLRRFSASARLRPSFSIAPGLEGPVPGGFHPNPGHGTLGAGAADFEGAKRAIRAWRMFPEWVLLWPRGPIAVGEIAIAGTRVWGVWAANACRIVEVIDEPRRFGFVYATVAGHALEGAERFVVHWEPDDRVTYEVFSISRTASLIPRLTLPLLRQIQRRFARDSVAAMQAAVREQGSRDRTATHQDV